MPTYEYACIDCGHKFEIVQSFSDEALTTCPECGGSLRKVFGSVGIVFKGSGFYKTDSRGSTSTAAKTPSSEPATNSSPDSTGSSTKEPASPAPQAPTSATPTSAD
jgi:putative FmdB family regulatory protein